MTQELKVSWDEIIGLIEKTYGISEIHLKRNPTSDYSGDMWETPDYITGTFIESKKEKRKSAIPKRVYPRTNIGGRPMNPPTFIDKIFGMKE